MSEQNNMGDASGTGSRASTEPQDASPPSASIPIAWEELRAKEIARRVQTEPGFILANGHRLMTCGPHTGHVWQAIAFCEDPTWATAIAQAIEARRDETGTGSVHESAVGNADAPQVHAPNGGTP